MITPFRTTGLCGWRVSADDVLCVLCVRTFSLPSLLLCWAESQEYIAKLQGNNCTKLVTIDSFFYLRDHRNIILMMSYGSCYMFAQLCALNLPILLCLLMSTIITVFIHKLARAALLHSSPSQVLYSFCFIRERSNTPWVPDIQISLCQFSLIIWATVPFNWIANHTRALSFIVVGMSYAMLHLHSAKLGIKTKL